MRRAAILVDLVGSPSSPIESGCVDVGDALGAEGADGGPLGGVGVVGDALGGEGADGGPLGGVGADGGPLGGEGADGGPLGGEGADGGSLGGEGADGDPLGGTVGCSLIVSVVTDSLEVAEAGVVGEGRMDSS